MARDYQKTKANKAKRHARAHSQPIANMAAAVPNNASASAAADDEEVMEVEEETTDEINNNAAGNDDNDNGGDGDGGGNNGDVATFCTKMGKQSQGRNRPQCQYDGQRQSAETHGNIS